MSRSHRKYTAYGPRRLWSYGPVLQARRGLRIIKRNFLERIAKYAGEIKIGRRGRMMSNRCGMHLVSSGSFTIKASQSSPVFVFVFGEAALTLNLSKDGSSCKTISVQGGSVVAILDAAEHLVLEKISDAAITDHPYIAKVMRTCKSAVFVFYNSNGLESDSSSSSDSRNSDSDEDLRTSSSSSSSRQNVSGEKVLPCYSSGRKFQNSDPHEDDDNEENLEDDSVAFILSPINGPQRDADSEEESSSSSSEDENVESEDISTTEKADSITPEQSPTRKRETADEEMHPAKKRKVDEVVGSFSTVSEVKTKESIETPFLFQRVIQGWQVARWVASFF